MTKDIELSEADFEEMEPSVLKGIHDKLRQANADITAYAHEMRDEAASVKHQLGNEQLRLSHALAREARQQRILALVGEKFITLGALDALSLSMEQRDDS